MRRLASSTETFLIISISFIGLVTAPFIDELQQFILLAPTDLGGVQLRLEWVQKKTSGEWVEDVLNT